jgi:hypothetical protein
LKVLLLKELKKSERKRGQAAARAAGIGVLLHLYSAIV